MASGQICLHCSSTSLEPSPRSARVLELLPNDNETPAFHDNEERSGFLALRGALAQEDRSIKIRMEEITQEYQSLVKRQATICRVQEDLSRMFKPVPRLPTKLLQKIFVMARDTLTVQADTFAPAFVHDSLPESSFNTAPWNISQVCRRWRTASIDYSHLWSYFGMDLQKRRERPSNNALCLAAIQIARAAGSDLHFSLQCDAATAYMLPSIIPLCIVSASRWKCLELTVQNPVMLSDFKIVAPMLDCLESLHIRIHDGRLPLPGAHISSIFQDAYHLTEVVESSYDVTRIILPWTNIERSS